MSSIEKLTEFFIKFPGIGPRQARRFVYFLLRVDDAFVLDFTRLLTSLRDTMGKCTLCRRMFERSDSAVCNICADPQTNKETVLVVEKDVDFENVQKSKGYGGQYFVLGAADPLSSRGKDATHIQALMQNIEQRKREGGLQEIIIALSANPEGDTAAAQIKDALAPLAKKHSLKISTLGRGLSTGTELEYSDDDTIKNALQNRS